MCIINLFRKLDASNVKCAMIPTVYIFYFHHGFPSYCTVTEIYLVDKYFGDINNLLVNEGLTAIQCTRMFICYLAIKLSKR